MRVLFFILAVLVGLGCSSMRWTRLATKRPGPNGGKADNLENVDGGLVEGDGDIITADAAFDAGATDGGEALSDSEPVVVNFRERLGRKRAPN